MDNTRRAAAFSLKRSYSQDSLESDDEGLLLTMPLEKRFYHKKNLVLVNTPGSVNSQLYETIANIPNVEWLDNDTKQFIYVLLKSQGNQRQLESANISNERNENALRRYFTIGRLREAAKEAKKFMNLTPEEDEFLTPVMTVALAEVLNYKLGCCSENTTNSMINYFYFLQEKPQLLVIADKCDVYKIRDKVSDHVYWLILPAGQKIFSTNSPDERPNFKGGLIYDPWVQKGGSPISIISAMQSNINYQTVTNPDVYSLFTKKDKNGNFVQLTRRILEEHSIVRMDNSLIEAYSSAIKRLRMLPREFLSNLDKKIKMEAQEQLDCKYPAKIFPDDSMRCNTYLMEPELPLVRETRAIIREARAKLYPQNEARPSEPVVTKREMRFFRPISYIQKVDEKLLKSVERYINDSLSSYLARVHEDKNRCTSFVKKFKIKEHARQHAVKIEKKEYEYGPALSIYCTYDNDKYKNNKAEIDQFFKSFYSWEELLEISEVYCHRR